MWLWCNPPFKLLEHFAIFCFLHGHVFKFCLSQICGIESMILYNRNCNHDCYLGWVQRQHFLSSSFWCLNGSEKTRHVNAMQSNFLPSTKEEHSTLFCASPTVWLDSSFWCSSGSVTSSNSGNRNGEGTALDGTKHVLKVEFLCFRRAENTISSLLQIVWQFMVAV